jgi:hypothetical protein
MSFFDPLQRQRHRQQFLHVGFSEIARHSFNPDA